MLASSVLYCNRAARTLQGGKCSSAIAIEIGRPRKPHRGRVNCNWPVSLTGGLVEARETETRMAGRHDRRGTRASARRARLRLLTAAATGRILGSGHTGSGRKRLRGRRLSDGTASWRAERGMTKEARRPERAGPRASVALTIPEARRNRAASRQSMCRCSLRLVSDRGLSSACSCTGRIGRSHRADSS
jgi:hypothetical protein